MNAAWPAWPSYLWAAVVALAIAAGALTASRRPDIRPALALPHVAAAALIGSFGWEMLIHLPGTVFGYWGPTMSLGDVRGDWSYVAVVGAQAAFVVASGCAVVGLLRRRAWGAVLGVGLATAVAVFTLLTVVQFSVQFGSAIGDSLYTDTFLAAVAAGVVPAVVTVALLAWPLVRRDRDTPARADSNAHWSAASASDAGR